MTARRVSSTTRVVRAVTRAAGEEDCLEVVRLLCALGFGAGEGSVARCLRSGGQVVVATVLGEVAGVAVLEWLHPIQNAQAEAWVTALVTGAQFRHRGVARALLAECARRVRQAGGDRLQLTAALERDEVRGFLRAAGFEPGRNVYERRV